MIILITGGAGTGKTFLANRLRNIHKDWYFTGMTNECASLINGKTIHKHFGFNKDNPWFNEITKPSNKRATIVIDEASMLNQQQLEMMVKARPYHNFILIGDFNQLLPVEGAPIRPDWIDETYVLIKPYRSIDIRLHLFLEGLLNNKIDWSVIEERKAERSNDKTLFVTYENKSITEYNKLFKLVKGSPVKGRDYKIAANGRTKIGYRNGSETRFDKAFWYNNELFKIIDITEYDVVLWNQRHSDAISLEKSIFEDYFIPNFATTFHGVQGQTVKGDLIVHLDSLCREYQNPDLRMRALYVACSRVINLENLYFAYKDINTIKSADFGYTYSFTALSSNVKVVDQDWIIEKGVWGYALTTKVCVYHTANCQVLLDQIKSIDDSKLKTPENRTKRKDLCKQYIEKVLNEPNLPSNAELARKLGVSRGTIINYIKELSK
ncbi:hypothetical protein AGMMS50268_27730 [Spirochaetia bacterium]|nr:hypothetical protein AGMMS50268_27730 [Spirochaetia bacterium]